MEQLQVAAGNGTCTVRVDGPESRHAVLLLPGVGDPADVYDDVCTRLHNSDLRTYAVESVDGLGEGSLLGLLDELKLAWVNLVGSREGADLAWLLAARTFGRFASLVVADSGHPAVVGSRGAKVVSDCPAVELPTTLMIGKSTTRACADESGRRVFADFRVVELDGIDNVPAQAGHEMATEIVLRTSSW
ncbi:alpha/beta hydrolase [Antrihabitans cavernicola]|uniref:Alpha/beta hydrolase n=1 Tax=Antrihabitans cavernicola TaxID=2495913 RepID=A0A5A7SEY4_9NOCA|nr:alpha/beta hydrolase [Spelaeibacter cavernicola]KAA0023267.1 alpha/beta hydrolase [Spelaeibacter cavernicola]